MVDDDPDADDDGVGETSSVPWHAIATALAIRAEAAHVCMSLDDMKPLLVSPDFAVQELGPSMFSHGARSVQYFSARSPRAITLTGDHARNARITRASPAWIGEYWTGSAA